MIIRHRLSRFDFPSPPSPSLSVSLDCLANHRAQPSSNDSRREEDGVRERERGCCSSCYSTLSSLTSGRSAAAAAAAEVAKFLWPAAQRRARRQEQTSILWRLVTCPSTCTQSTSAEQQQQQAEEAIELDNRLCSTLSPRHF